jgi:putative mRNA 3-end processing factor
LGGCEEVGRSAISVQCEERNILLDYGVMMNHEVGFPVHVPPREIDAIFLSHAHLDHTGSTPIFYVTGRIPMYGVEPTFRQTELLIKDFINLTGYYLPFEYLDLQSMMEHCISVPYRKEILIGETKVSLLNAGHIPGSSQVLVESGGKRLLYTGDFNSSQTQLLQSADQDYGDLDGVIMESTYAEQDHPHRLEMEAEFVNRAREVVERGGTVLVPAFGVGRSQEILCVLEAHHFDYPIFVDGMALKANRILVDYPESLRDPDLFSRAIRRAEWIDQWHDRRRAAKSPCVIVSPAGMLKGGAAIFYMESVSMNKKNAIFLVSFQIPGTPGRILQEKGQFMLRGKMRRVEACVEKFDFSSHCGRQELRQTLLKLNKKTKVFVLHGAEDSCASLASWASQEAGLEAQAVKTGQTIEI